MNYMAWEFQSSKITVIFVFIKKTRKNAIVEYPDLNPMSRSKVIQTGKNAIVEYLDSKKNAIVEYLDYQILVFWNTMSVYFPIRCSRVPRLSDTRYLILLGILFLKFLNLINITARVYKLRLAEANFFLLDLKLYVHYLVLY